MGLGNRGQIVFVYIMVAIIAFIMAINFIPAIKDQVTSVTNETITGGTSAGLNCSSTLISTEQQVTCQLVDMSMFYFVSICIACGLALLSGRRTITGVLTSITVFIVVVLLITPLKTLIILARDSGHLDCTNTAITIGSKMLCIFTDLWLFYFVVTAIAAGITFIALKTISVDGGQQ